VAGPRRKLGTIGKAGLITLALSNLGGVLYSGTDIGPGALYAAITTLAIGVVLLAVEELQFRRNRVSGE
jgi:hypothetical protein